MGGRGRFYLRNPTLILSNKHWTHELMERKRDQDFRQYQIASIRKLGVDFRQWFHPWPHRWKPEKSISTANHASPSLSSLLCLFPFPSGYESGKNVGCGGSDPKSDCVLFLSPVASRSSGNYILITNLHLLNHLPSPSSLFQSHWLWFLLGMECCCKCIVSFDIQRISDVFNSNVRHAFFPPCSRLVNFILPKCSVTQGWKSVVHSVSFNIPS